jgi:1,2-phenylacetyl-CoA epoxidase PaaB subunit
MSNTQSNHETKEQILLLPFGETLRPLISASSLECTDLKDVLQRRGIFVKKSDKRNIVPVLTSILLSPREFDFLRNKQDFKENRIKTSDAKATWNVQTKTVVQAIPEDIEKFAKKLEDDSSYKLINCVLHRDTEGNEVVIKCNIERTDWKKDVLSYKTYHDCKLSITKKDNAVFYSAETTVPETKKFISKFQDAIHSYFQKQEVVSNDIPMQRILTDKFRDNKEIFNFLDIFTKQNSNILSFQKIVDIHAGIDHNIPNFPENFKWLKDVDKINLHGKLNTTDIMDLSKKGILVFGEIEAEFKFDSTKVNKAKGMCTIKYGFPKFYEKRKSVEFEAKIGDLNLHIDFSDISKNRVEVFLLKEFQKDKHQIFDKFQIDREPQSSFNW